MPGNNGGDWPVPPPFRQGRRAEQVKTRKEADSLSGVTCTRQAAAARFPHEVMRSHKRTHEPDDKSSWESGNNNLLHMLNANIYSDGRNIFPLTLISPQLCSPPRHLLQLGL